jgi:hypothetical protein
MAANILVMHSLLALSATYLLDFGFDFTEKAQFHYREALKLLQRDVHIREKDTLVIAAIVLMIHNEVCTISHFPQRELTMSRSSIGRTRPTKILTGTAGGKLPSKSSIAAFRAH